ncbi:MAG: hypothetical protein AAB426_07990 [Myxococcota bacterium]
MTRRPMTPIAVVLTALTLHASATASAGPTKIAVLPLAAKRVPAATVEILDDFLVNEVGVKSGGTVMSIQELNAVIGLDRIKDALGCNDVACAAQLGGALGVDVLLTGSVSVLGGELIVSLSLIDARATAPTRRAQARVADDERQYAHAIAAAVAQLYNLPAPPLLADSARPSPSPARADRHAGLWVRSDVDAVRATVRSASTGEVHVCAKLLGSTEPCYFDRLPSGSTTVDLEHPNGKLSFDLVLRGGQLDRRVELVRHARAVPLVLTSLLVAGGAGTVLLALRAEDTGHTTTGEPTWGDGKTATFAGGAAALLLGTTGLVITLARGAYELRESHF